MPAPWAAPLAAQSGGPPLAPDHWAYELLDGLDVAGAAVSWARDVRPVGRGVVRGELARSVRHGFGGGETAEAWLRRFDARHPARASAREAALGSSLELGAEAGVRDGRAWLDPGTGAYAGLRGAAVLGSRASLWAEGEIGGRERFDGLRSGGLALDVGPFTAMAARQPLKAAGPARSSSQLGPVVPQDALYLVSREPRPFPGLEWLFGPVTWQFALAPWAGVAGEEAGWVGTGAAAGQPHPRFRIGATRSATFAREGSPGVTPARFFRMVFLMQNEPFEWDNQKLELWARYRWALFGQPLASYVVLAQEDSPLYLDPGVLVGTKAARLTGSGLWQLAWEYRAYGPRARWCAWCERVRAGLSESGREQDQWYVHGSRQQTYQRQGLPLGDPVGGYGAGHRLELTHFSDGAAVRGRLWAFFQVREDERNLLHGRWPGKRRGVGVEMAWYPLPALELGAAAVTADGPLFESERGLRVWAGWTGGWGG